MTSDDLIHAIGYVASASILGLLVWYAVALAVEHGVNEALRKRRWEREEKSDART